MNASQFTVLDHVFLPTKLPRITPWDNAFLFDTSSEPWLLLSTGSLTLRKCKTSGFRVEVSVPNGAVPTDRAYGPMSRFAISNNVLFWGTSRLLTRSLSRNCARFFRGGASVSIELLSRLRKD